MIGTLFNSTFNQKSPAEQGEIKLIIPKRNDGMPDYNAVQKFAELNGLRSVKDLDTIQRPLSGDEYVLVEKLRDHMKITSQ